MLFSVVHMGQEIRVSPHMVKQLCRSSADTGQKSNGSKTPLYHSTYQSRHFPYCSAQQPQFVSPGLQTCEETSSPQHGPGSSSHPTESWTIPKLSQHCSIHLNTPTRYTHEQQDAATEKYTSRAAKYRLLLHKILSWAKGGTNPGKKMRLHQLWNRVISMTSSAAAGPS